MKAFPTSALSARPPTWRHQRRGGSGACSGPAAARRSCATSHTRTRRSSSAGRRSTRPWRSSDARSPSWSQLCASAAVVGASARACIALSLCNAQGRRGSDSVPSSLGEGGLPRHEAALHLGVPRISLPVSPHHGRTERCRVFGVTPWAPEGPLCSEFVRAVRLLFEQIVAWR